MREWCWMCCYLTTPNKFLARINDTSFEWNWCKNHSDGIHRLSSRFFSTFFFHLLSNVTPSSISIFIAYRTAISSTPLFFHTTRLLWELLRWSQYFYDFYGPFYFEIFLLLLLSKKKREINLLDYRIYSLRALPCTNWFWCNDWTTLIKSWFEVVNLNQNRLRYMDQA